MDAPEKQSPKASADAVPARYVKRMVIKGFKKFSDFSIEFNPRINILVGENEAGKSTIIEALRLVLCQLYRNADRSILFDLFNQDEVKRFKQNPTFELLPSIHIEALLEIPDKDTDSQLFLGQNHVKDFGDGALFGIRFECEFDNIAGAGLDSEISKGYIPVEYYKLEWKTFAGQTYYWAHRPLRFLAVDTSSHEPGNPFDRYAKDLFLSRVDEKERLQHKNLFRKKLKDLAEELKFPSLSDEQKFRIDDKRILLENVLAIFDDGIALENKGSGAENIVKIKLALSAKGAAADVIAIEEPESHLSHSNLRKLLNDVQAERSTSQIIVATHSNMIVSRLDVRNVLWISDERRRCERLNDVNKGTADFFAKIDRSNLLDLLLARKVILVEGATEYMLIPKFYKDILGKTIENDNVTVISCNGISYRHYLEIAETRQKRVVAITDNDGDSERIKKAQKYNASHKYTQVFMPDDDGQWTWEKCLYELNKECLEKILPLQDGASYFYHGKNLGKCLGYMLNNKAEAAYCLLKKDPALKAPAYIDKAIRWLGE